MPESDSRARAIVKYLADEPLAAAAEVTCELATKDSPPNAPLVDEEGGARWL